MPKGESQIDSGRLLGAAAAAGAIGGSAVAVSRRAAQKARAKVVKPKTAIQKKRARLSATRKHAKVPAVVHPKKKMAAAARQANPAMFKKIVRGQRLAAKAAKASARGLGVLGMVANAPGLVSEAQAVEAEGGSFANRFGKYVERILGAPAGMTGRGMTDEERDDAWST